ncbi:Os10g0473875 [Oryza sativa Japonica Group]|uniref:Os10g0473875 protein n=1 Tax=Oryza sativa subsp. japonica TaxID=39947 RepID=A0A0P0XVY3_ORYSJ|nr:hypothetical protein EE612_051806 [Oryza sativa]BAT11276.1 Os10g0473875 [Oryza sativa Japonica Group]
MGAGSGTGSCSGRGSLRPTGMLPPVAEGSEGGGGRMPSTPRPALSLPGMLMRLKNGRSPGLDGTGLSFPSHSTNRGALGSPNTRSSLSPLSTERALWAERRRAARRHA